MASVNFLKTCAAHSSKLLRNNFLNCCGSNQKIRNSSSKLFGFSASVTIFGFGIQAYRNTADSLGNSRRENTSDFDRGIRSIAKLQQLFFKENTVLENLRATRKKCPSGGGFSLFNAINSFSLLTPVFCLGEGEDIICKCSSKKDSTSAEICKGRFPKGSSKENCDQQVPSNSCPPRQSPSSKSCKNGNSSSGGCKTSGPTVSNKPCRTESNCSRKPEIDIDALSQELGGIQQINFMVDSDLSHCFLIKQASQITVDSVTRIVTETVAAYEDYHAEYRRVLDMMLDTLEESRKACGSDLEVLECKIMLIRGRVDEMKRRIQEMDMFLGSLEKLGNASAETAFMASAEYASVAMMERLQSLCIEVKRLRDLSKEKERDMLELQSLIIVESGKSLK